MSSVPDTRALMKATPISGWGQQSIGLATSKTFDPVKQQNEGAPEGWRMSAKADGRTYKQFTAAGWTDAKLREYGYLEAVPPTASDGQAPVTRRHGWVFVTNTLNGTITATEPDGTQHAAQRGDMNTLAGRDMLNAMTRDLTKPAATGDLTKALAERNEAIFALKDAWPYVHGNCTIEPKRKRILAVLQKHGDGADLDHVKQAIAEAAALTRPEIVALTCMQAGAPWQDHLIDGLVELFAIHERLRAEGKRPVDPADMTEAEQAAHWAGSPAAEPGKLAVTLTHQQVQALYLTLFHGRMGGVQRPETRPAWGWMEQPLCEVEQALAPAHRAISDGNFDELNRAFWGAKP